MAETKEIVQAIRDHEDRDLDMEIQRMEILTGMLCVNMIDDDGTSAPCFDEIDKSRIRKKMFDIIDNW